MWSAGIARDHSSAFAERNDSSRGSLALFLLYLSALGALILAGTPTGPLEAQDAAPAYDPALFDGMEYRMIGPYRGGRSTAVTGHPTDPNVFYTGTTGGGVWVTDDAGKTWDNITDGFFDVAPVGALDVADTDPNVIYVGTGSACIRGNVSTGKGVYRSTDGGDTWSHVGLTDIGQVGDLKIHPSDPDVAYIAALGHAFGPNPDRGVYRTTDGGQSWEQVLFVSDSTGFVDLAMNPDNPREIYASAWRAERKPWVIISGASEAGIWKTTDGGDSWEKLGGGLPTGLFGKSSVAVSPANPDRVWALVEAPEPDGGVYRSDDRGKTWVRVNENRKLRQRAYYYMHLEPDPQDENTVYAMNTGLYRSVDGGRTFDPISVPHGDVHDLWINPDDPTTMIVADDGGGQVSVNNGRTWTDYYNQPTAEFYSVTVDNQFPYRVYGPQQDNSTITVPSWFSADISPEQYWHSIGGCETGPVAMDPDNPDLIYSGCYGGVIDRWDARTGEERNIMVYPQMQLGSPAEDLQYRFQWVSPIEVDPHDANTIYHASNRLFRTTDAGMSWEPISPDLTTNNPAHQHCGGQPITCEGTGVEVFNTIFSVTVSPHERGVIWAGTDDGRVHLTRDGGGSWSDVTPGGVQIASTVDVIEVSPHDPAKAYLAVHRYRMDDFSPYLYRTADYGETWHLLTDGSNGIPGDHPVRVVREDPDRQGLLYAGTEFGLFVSFDDGARWQSLQHNLPVVPVTDIKVHRRDLVLATQGRSFWILDDITPLHEVTPALASAPAHLYAPRGAYRVSRGGSGDGKIWPENPPEGAVITYFLAEDATQELTMEILDSSGSPLKSYSSRKDEAEDGAGGEDRPQREADPVLPASAGSHRFAWDLRTEGVDVPPDAVTSWGYTGGVTVIPGPYTVRLTMGDWSQEQALRVLADPRLDAVTAADLQEQWRLATEVKDSLSTIYANVERLRRVRELSADMAERLEMEGAEMAAEAREMADSIAMALTGIEDDIINTNSQSRQDPINFQPMLDHQFTYLYGYVADPHGRPTQGSYDRMEDLSGQWTVLRERLENVMNGIVAEYNAMLRRQNIAPIISQEE
jgi:photosystem II stability/assembly factor-like uncharacterized protein